MSLSIFDKFDVIFNYIFSSFIPIGLLVIFFLILTLLILNFKYKNNTFNVVIIGILIGTMFGIILSHSDYVLFSIKEFVKEIMNYYYFPSPVMYFFIILISIGICINTILDKKIGSVKKIFNFVVTTSIYYLFFLFIVRSTMNGLVFVDITSIYTDDVALSLIQVSNLLFVLWIVVTVFNKLYIFYKKKFD